MTEQIVVRNTLYLIRSLNKVVVMTWLAAAFCFTGFVAIEIMTGDVSNITLSAWREVESMIYAGRMQIKRLDDQNINPAVLTDEQASAHAILILHGAGADETSVLSTAQAIHAAGIGPVYTYSYQKEAKIDQLKEKISEIREQYLVCGKDHVIIDLVGHSLGAITAADYTFRHQDKVIGTTIGKVISIAGRLQVTESVWFRFFFKDLRSDIEVTYAAMQEHPKKVDLYTIAADHDWLVPIDAVLVHDDPKRLLVVKNRSHLSVLYASETSDKIIEWLAGVI